MVMVDMIWLKLIFKRKPFATSSMTRGGFKTNAEIAKFEVPRFTELAVIKESGVQLKSASENDPRRPRLWDSTQSYELWPRNR
ncbi:hypothetical protein VCV18_012252 [Metarhizium anisopliae]